MQPQPVNQILQTSSLQLSPEFDEQLRKHVVQHIAADIIKSLLIIKTTDLVSARNIVDVPMGLFGLSLDDFYVRRENNIVYLDVLQLLPTEMLEQAKICIVLDDVQNYVKWLFDCYGERKLTNVLKVISDSEKMLTIHLKIEDDYKKNMELQKQLLSKLGAFSVRERQALLYMQGQLHNAQNNYVEAQLVLDPIEFRYKLNFYAETEQQYKEHLQLTEENIKRQLEHIVWQQTREVVASDFIRTKQQNDILNYKKLLNDMTRRYNTDYDTLDSDIVYKTNAMLSMKEQRRECEERLIIFEIDKPRLMTWLEEWHNKCIAPVVKAKRPKKKAGKKR